MSIAETIKAGFNEHGDYTLLIAECVNYAGDASDQDWEYETTQYNFIDVSCIVICNNEVTVYNSQN